MPNSGMDKQLQQLKSQLNSTAHQKASILHCGSRSLSSRPGSTGRREGGKEGERCGGAGVNACRWASPRHSSHVGLKDMGGVRSENFGDFLVRTSQRTLSHT